jgi:hypothetical protein
MGREQRVGMREGDEGGDDHGGSAGGLGFRRTEPVERP